MPAKNLLRVTDEGGCSHVYNKGVEGRVIFADEQDYSTFIGYLKEYLSPPVEAEKFRKTFTVKGKTFQGAPRLPNNYYSRVELVAYSLKPNHFHLILLQNTQNSIQSFLKSLGTRYSMYYNKKYLRSGPLFEGPYKSVQIREADKLMALTAFIHQSSGCSSHPEYMGQRETSWVNKNLALMHLTEGSYQKLFEKYVHGQMERGVLDGITLEPEPQHFAGSSERSEPASLQVPKSHSIRLPEFALTVVLFMALSGLGALNIEKSSIETLATTSISTISTPRPQVISAVSEVSENVLQAKQIKIIDSGKEVEIYREPSASSEVVAKAVGGDTFEVVSNDREWYQVKLADGAGHISAEYVEGNN